jgi:hypothetical protein
VLHAVPRQPNLSLLPTKALLPLGCRAFGLPAATVVLGSAPGAGYVTAREQVGGKSVSASGSRNGRAGLRIGELVEVRSVDEILATLDERGRLEALPFMPEMLKYSGRRFRVYRRAIKLCDTANSTGMHRMHDAVHLEGLRCDGSAHGGCQAGCLLYWKEAWLKRVEPGESPAAPGRLPVPALLADATRADGVPPSRQDGEDGDVAFSCQATELTKAAPERMPWWDARQYVRDVTSGNARPLAMLRSLVVMLFNKFQAANRRFLPGLPLIRNAKRWPFIEGRLTKTPREVLDLKPGELVEVKSREEIFQTLDTRDRNRGMMFDTEMLRYCGKRYRVLRRVERIIDEKTGKMMHLRGDCIVLEGVTCTAEYNQYCPRSIYPYWREIWLRRVEEPR